MIYHYLFFLLCLVAPPVFSKKGSTYLIVYQIASLLMAPKLAHDQLMISTICASSILSLVLLIDNYGFKWGLDATKMAFYIMIFIGAVSILDNYSYYHENRNYLKILLSLFASFVASMTFLIWCLSHFKERNKYVKYILSISVAQFVGSLVFGHAAYIGKMSEMEILRSIGIDLLFKLSFHSASMIIILWKNSDSENMKAGEKIT